jgi:hypothetical protein
MKKLLIFLLVVLFSLPSHAQVTSSGVSSDGRDFYVGFVNPSYNTVASPPVKAFFGAFVLVSSYTGSQVTVSYFDRKTGVEFTEGNFAIPGRTGIQIPLDLTHMFLDTNDFLDFAACHVTATSPVNVEFFSTGACAGGSYLALATPTLGKKYVIASYNNNGGVLGLPNGNDGPAFIENSRGFFLITAPFDSTTVTIISNSTTSDGHPGYHSGAHPTFPLIKPYSVLLRRGQSYLVKSARGDDEADDISGSIVQSDKPVAVLGGQENAALGDANNRLMEGRDYMVEQMIPVDFWDTTGYVSIPLKDSQPPDVPGAGENYRTYSFDSLGANINMYVASVSGPVAMSTIRLAQPPPEKFQVTDPVDFEGTNFEGTNTKKFSVMMYDNRMFSASAPFPAPSMMTIIPMSRWKTSYAWYVPANKFETLQGYFVNIIAQRQDFGANGLFSSFNGGPLVPFISSALNSLDAKFNASIPNHPELTGARYKLQPGSYFVTGPHPFIVYNYGFRGIDPEFDLGDFDGDDFFFEYANPVGASLSSGDTANFKVTIDSLCGKWNICVVDKRTTDRGIRSVSLIDDPAGFEFPPPGRQASNSYLDSAFDVNNIGEVDLDGLDSAVCFTVHIRSAFAPAYAPVLVTDNAGNNLILDLHYAPPHLSVSPSTLTVNFTDIFLGKDSCSSVTVRNTDSVAHTINATSWNVGKNFVITSTVPALPVTLKHNDSLEINLCFQSKDTTHVADDLLFNLDCLPVQIAVSGNGGIGLIYASDKDFGRVFNDSTKCDTVGIYNIGTYPFTVRTVTVTGSSSFSFVDSVLLPFIVLPGQKKLLTVCYTPKVAGNDTAIIHWTTDISAPFTESIKSFSILTGQSIVKSAVEKPNLSVKLSIRPNPANGNSVVISFGDTPSDNAEIKIYDVLGREMYKRNILGLNQVEIPIRGLQNGIYYAQVTIGGKVMMQKFEVMR